MEGLPFFSSPSHLAVVVAFLCRQQLLSRKKKGREVERERERGRFEPPHPLLHFYPARPSSEDDDDDDDVFFKMHFRKTYLFCPPFFAP